MNKLAEELNSQLQGTVAGRLLSRLGSRFYFPKGIVAQAGEAKKAAHTANATIGMAFSGGKPLVLSAIADCVPTLTPEQIVAYAPTAGVEQLRKEWQSRIIQKNPSLNQEKISLPVVTTGLTGGLSAIADLFVEEGQTVITCDPCWDNYTLIFDVRREGTIRNIPFFGNLGNGSSMPGMDLDTISRTVREEAKKGQVRIVLNFPNNPAGYSPTKDEAKALKELFLEVAEGGADVLVMCDDAYFGFFYEDSIYEESPFSFLADLHERILAVKIDGPIKEDYVWGLRIGLVTLGSRGLKQEHYNALNAKLTGAIRATVSCSSTPAQYFIIKALEDNRTAGEKTALKNMMKSRYTAVKTFIAGNPDHPVLKPYPCNSGYFVSFECKGVSSEALRQELLSKHGIGVVSLGDKCLRIAFSSLDEEQIAPVFSTVYEVAAKML
jgi:aspartate/methionine/tyrosine aminotransferase